MRFVVALVNAASGVGAENGINGKEKYLPAVQVTGNVFWEYARIDGFASLSSLGGLGEPQKKFLMDALVALVMENWEDVFTTAAEFYPGMSAETIRLGAGGGEMPNIFSLFHVVAENLVAEHVFQLHLPQLTLGQSQLLND